MKPENTEIFVASAGTGKTTRMMNILGELLENGADPSRIVYTTMSRTGTAEGRERASARFSQLTENNMQYFKTLHSIAYRYNPVKQMMRRSDYIELGNQTGYSMVGADPTAVGGGPMSFSLGDKILGMDKIRRLRRQSYEDCLYAACEPWLNIKSFKYLGESYANYKRSMGVIDYTDMIQHFVEEGTTLPVDYMFVDEAQDSSRLQWEMIKNIGANCKKVYIAGDDKQCIYEFAGADPDSLIELEGNRIILDQSYRIPPAVHDYAENLAARITKKAAYEFKPREGEGKVQRIGSLNQVNFNEGSWLLLARNRKYLAHFENECMKQGVLFHTIGSGGDSDLPDFDDIQVVVSWNKLLSGGLITGKEVKRLYGSYLPARDRVKTGFKKVAMMINDEDLFPLETLVQKYGLLCTAKWDIALNLNERVKEYLKIVEQKEGLLSDPRIEINTIHGVKGKEADNVVVLPDMSQLSYRELEYNPDAEHRVFYVAATRAKENLYICAPLQSKNYYSL